MDVSVKNMGGIINSFMNGEKVNNTISIDWKDSKFEKPKNPTKLKENRLIEIPSDEINDGENDVLLEIQTSNGTIISNDIDYTVAIPRLYVNGNERKIGNNFKWLIDGVDQRLGRPFIKVNKQYFNNNGDFIQLTFEYDDFVSEDIVMQRVDDFHGNRDMGDNDGENVEEEIIRTNILEFDDGFKTLDGYEMPIEAIQLYDEPKGVSTHQNFWNLKFYEGNEKRSGYWFDKTFRVRGLVDYTFNFDFQYLGHENINGLSFGVNILYSNNEVGGDSNNPVYIFNKEEFVWDELNGVEFDRWVIDIPILSMGQNNYSMPIPPTDDMTNVWLMIHHPFKSTDSESYVSLQKIELRNE